MSPATTWRTDDPCPVCGSALIRVDVGAAQVTDECRLCGWATTWDTLPERSGQ